MRNSFKSVGGIIQFIVTSILFIHLCIILKCILLDYLSSCFCSFVLLLYDHIFIDFTNIKQL